MSVKVKLTVRTGSLSGRAFIFGTHTHCTIGRAGDCLLRLPKDPEYQTISRHHCVLDIDPPVIRVRDLGSRNGTYVNGRNIGQRAPQQPPAQVAPANGPGYDLAEGDEVRLGDTVFQVGLLVPAVCDACGQEIPNAPRESAELSDEESACPACRQQVYLERAVGAAE